MGLELALPVVIFLWLGHRMDSWLGNETPWFMLVGALLGGVVGLYVFLRRLLPGQRGAEKG
jgi:LPXTG-motif cell wall-anchored protein